MSDVMEAAKQSNNPMGPENRCADFDEDCRDIACKVGCWLYAPEEGWCPFLYGRGNVQ